MACPFFEPREPWPQGGEQAAMLPLGDAFSGICHAAPDAPLPARADDAAQRPLCNLGYARGQCSRFPATATAPDAVRFAIASDRGDSIAIRWSTERDHRPAAHGALEYSRLSARLTHTLLDAPPDLPWLWLQAQAYVESYLRRKRASAWQ